MPHKHNKPRIYKTAGQVDMIIETAYLILMLIPLKGTLGLLLLRVLESLFLKESLLCLFSIPPFFRRFNFMAHRV